MRAVVERVRHTKVYANDEVTDCVYGGVAALDNEIDNMSSYIDTKSGNDVLVIE